MSRRIIIPKGLVNPQETTVIEIPEELSEEMELIASPTCPTSCNDTTSGSSSGSPSYFLPEATSSPNPRPIHDQTWNVPTYSSIYDSSEMSYSMEPSNSIFGETYDVPPRNPCTESYGSDRSESASQGYSSYSSSDRTYNIPPGGAQTLGRTQTMSDRSGNLGQTYAICPAAERTHNIPPGGAQILGRTQTLSDRSEDLGETYNISSGSYSNSEQTYSIPTDRTQTMSDRSQNLGQTYSICPAAERTHNIPPGGAQILGRTQTITDRSGGFGRTYNVSAGADRTYNIPQGAAGILGRTQTIGPGPDYPCNVTRGGNRTFNVPQGGGGLSRTINKNTCARSGGRNVETGRTRTISTSPPSRATGNLSMTIRRSTTSIQESSYPESASFTANFSIPPATSTPVQPNCTYRIPHQTYTVPAGGGTHSDWGSSETSNHHGASYDAQSDLFNPQACSTIRRNNDFSRTANQFSNSYDTEGSSQYTSYLSTGSSCPQSCGSTGGDLGRSRNLHRRHSSTFSPNDVQPSAFKPQACSTIRRNDDFSRTTDQFNSSYDTEGSSQYTSLGATAGSSCPESCESAGGGPGRGRSLHRRHSSTFPQGVPSRITRTISKTYVTPVPRGDNASAAPSGNVCPGRSRHSPKSQTKIIKKTSKTIIKSPTLQDSTMQDSSSLHSQISSHYNDSIRTRRRPDRSCPGRTQSTGLGMLGSAYLNSTRRNDTAPPRINCASVMDSSLASPGSAPGPRTTSTPARMVQKVSRTRTEITTAGNQGRSAGSDIHAELQRMEESERSQLQEELRSFQDSRRALMGNASFTYGERDGSGSGGRQCQGPCHSNM